MKLLETEIQIAADVDRIWSILIDLDRYHEWNPFIKSARGKIEVGEKLEVVMSPPNGRVMTFKPTVTSVTHNSEYSWLGRLLFPGIFDGEHIFEIAENENGSKLVQREKFSGLLVPLLWSGLDKNTRAGFELMNAAIKQRAESESM